GIFFLSEVTSCQTEPGIAAFWILLERLAKFRHAVIIALRQPIEVPKLYVVVRKFRLQLNILEKFGFTLLVVGTVHVCHRKVEMQIRQLRIQRFGLSQLCKGAGNLVTLEIGFAENQMKLRRVSTNVNKPEDSLFVEFLVARATGSHTENVQIHYVAGHRLPKGLQCFHGSSVILREDLAQPKQVARLLRTGLIADDALQRGDGSGVIFAAEFDETDVQANARHFRGKPLCLL